MRFLLSALVVCLSLVASSARAVELNYTWKKGDVHRFTYEDESSMDMQLGGMPGIGGEGGSKMKLKVTSTFSQKVLAVKPDGSADVELTIERMDVTQGGQKAAALDKLPPSARVTKATVDRKGRAKFYQTVTVYMQDDQMYVGITKASASATGASVSAQAGGEKVELQMSINPKTGQVTSSATTSKVPPQLKKVEIREDAQKVDALPENIFEMMVLPEGDIAQGSTVTVDSPIGEMATTLDKFDQGVANLHFVLSGKEVSAKSVQTAGPTTVKTKTTNEEDGSTTEETTMAMPGMGGMPGMPGMGGMPGMPGMPGAGGKKTKRDAAVETAAMNSGAQTNVDMHIVFDVASGKLVSLQGTLDSKMSMGGMGNVTVHSTPKLTRR